MTITREQRPYEILFRYDEDGTLKGGHCIMIDAIIEDGIVIQTSPGLAQSIAIANRAGFPLSDIMDDVQIALAGTTETLYTENDKLKTERDIAVSKLETAEEKASIADLERKNAIDSLNKANVKLEGVNAELSRVNAKLVDM